MDNLEHTLANITLAPYIVKAMALIGVKRKGGSNMFRHQISTMGILLDYKMVDPVLLKAACIHDLFEDAASLPGVSKDEITSIDEVLKLADRISNMTALGFVHDVKFVRRFVAETRQFVAPYAAAINADMHRELSHLIENREQLLATLRAAHDPHVPVG
jgi:(p)ppGpp synthase/HD superfamily hydrolase